MKLAPGDKTYKLGGSYQATGTIVAAFITLSGLERYVFEFDTPPGMLHIFSPNQLEKINADTN